MLLISSPIPSIRITPAPPEKIHPEPYSPIPAVKLGAEDDGYRARWLSLPPSANSSPWHSSPVRPADRPPLGLARDQFSSLLKASREQRADLYRELAHRNQRLNQRTVERRALFLSKVTGTQYTTTSSIPKVPSEPSMIAHDSVSSCVLQAKLSALEVATENPENLVIVTSPTNAERDEQIGRGLPIAKRRLTSSKFPDTVLKKSRCTPPSLDEITARLKPVRVSSATDHSRSRLPNFLRALRTPSGSMGNQIKTVPVRSLALNDEKFDTTLAWPVARSQHPDPCTLRMGLGYAVTPRAVNTVAGPSLHCTRADTARDMIMTLKRRSSPPLGLGHRECTQIIVEVKRCSVPAALQRSTYWL